MNEYPLYRYAQVIDNVDPDQLGKVQVKIMPEFNGVLDDQLPWAYPESQGSSGQLPDIGKHSIPEIDSFVKVRITNKYWTNIEYLTKAPYMPLSYPYSSFVENFSIDELATTPEYPQPRFEKTNDGSIFFHDTSNGIMGIQHSTGLYVAIDEEGSLFIKFIKNLKIKNEDESISLQMTSEDGKVSIVSTDGEVEISAKDFSFVGDNFVIGEGSDNAVLYTPLEEVLKELLSHTHTSPAGPCTPAEKSDKSPLTVLTSKLQDMKSSLLTLD